MRVRLDHARASGAHSCPGSLPPVRFQKFDPPRRPTGRAVAGAYWRPTVTGAHP